MQSCSASHACAVAGLILLGLALTGVTIVIFDTVVGPRPGGSQAAALAAFVIFWFLIPLPLRRKADRSY